METDWREIFQVEQVVEPFNVQVGDCNANCQQAKELVCVCKCRGRNHGAHLKQHVQPLDNFTEPTAELVVLA